MADPVPARGGAVRARHDDRGSAANPTAGGWVASTLVAALTAAVLMLTAYDQFYDTNFYTLWEATMLLAGEHPYKDFYEWGVPMQAVASAVGQLALGNRLLGEFGLQWLGIVAGAVVSFRMALRLSGSTTASLATAAVPIVLVAATPTYHYPKLLFYPFAIWLAWRYIERPSVAVGAALGGTTAVAFLFRHDHGMYLAGASVLAFVLAMAAAPSVRGVWVWARHAFAYGAAALAFVAPWFVLVQTSEGLGEYVRQRLALQSLLVGTHSYWPFRALLSYEPLQPLVAAWRGRLLPPEQAIAWLMGTALLVPLTSLAVVALDSLRRRRSMWPVPHETCRVFLLAAFLAVLDNRLFREPSYVVVVAPLTAALAARLLAPHARRRPRGAAPSGRVTMVWTRAVGAGVSVVLLAGALVSAASFGARTGILAPLALVGTVPGTVARLLASPPVDGLLSPEGLRQYGDLGAAELGSGEHMRMRMRYLHDCTRPGDRILVTGSTPFDVSYYAGRSIAGGHLYWHQRWRSDPEHEAQAMALLGRQSVPFAVSTTDAVWDDFSAYPRVLAYLRTHYVELEGTEGRLLVDTRRTPSVRFEPMGWPCFK